jgi:hypothetical protein
MTGAIMAGISFHSIRQASRGSATGKAQGSWTDAFPMVNRHFHGPPEDHKFTVASMDNRRDEEGVQSRLICVRHPRAMAW